VGVRRDKEKEQENGGGREPDEERRAPMPEERRLNSVWRCSVLMKGLQAFHADNRHRSLSAIGALDFDTDLRRRY
jgi:hypothetical protein